MIPSCSPFSLSWQVSVTFSPAFTFLRLEAAGFRTRDVMLAPESSLKVIVFPSTLTATTVPFMSCVLLVAAASEPWTSSIPAVRHATIRTATLVMAPPSGFDWISLTVKPKSNIDATALILALRDIRRRIWRKTAQRLEVPVRSGGQIRPRAMSPEPGETTSLLERSADGGAPDVPRRISVPASHRVARLAARHRDQDDHRRGVAHIAHQPSRPSMWLRRSVLPRERSPGFSHRSVIDGAEEPAYKTENTPSRWQARKAGPISMSALRRAAFVAAVLGWIGGPGVADDGAFRSLTLQERVAAGRAIERIYYSHQVGATRSFEQALPAAQLETEVSMYLKQSAALERYWNTRVTAELLRKEIERMAQSTRMPERLRELYGALDDDSFLVAETLARPVLVRRLTRNFFAYDRTIHAAARQEAVALRDALVEGRISPFSEHANRSVLNLVESDAADEDRGDRTRMDLTTEEFETWRARMPGRVGEVGPLREDGEKLFIQVLLDKSPHALRIATYSVNKRPWEDWWNDVEAGLDSGAALVASRVPSSGTLAPVPRPTGAGSGSSPAPTAST